MHENNFLFIIPLIPKKMLTEERKILQDLCFSVLLKQNYTNWSVLVVGEYFPDIVKSSEHFMWLKSEGNKGDKIPQAVDYILDKNIECDYLIRLDDDDIFNPSILRELQYAKFDIFVDRQQFFWNSETKQISNKTWYWFANTTIQKREHALQKWEDVMDMHPNKLYVITKDHSSIHVYYQDKKILFSKSKSPLYIRSISNSSITAYNASSKESYLNSFGNWSTNNLKSYLFLGDSKKKVKQTFYRKMINLLSELRFRLHYNRIVLNK